MSERRNDGMERHCYSEDDVKILQSADLDKYKDQVLNRDKNNEV